MDTLTIFHLVSDRITAQRQLKRFNTDRGKLSVLVLLDLSAGFDTVDHNILLDRLENWVRFFGIVLKWFRTYFEGRG